jgi:DNA-binding response OmpR family regulator
MQPLHDTVRLDGASVTGADAAAGDVRSTLSILVVEPAIEDLLPAASALSATGFRVAVADTFAQAKTLLTTDPPSMLVTTLRLGVYNGLHLVHRGKALRPSLLALVTSPTADSVLQADSEAMGATFLVKPTSTQSLLAAVLRTIYRGPSAAPVRAPFERRQRKRRVSSALVHHERRSADRRRDLPRLVGNGAGFR